MVLTTLLHLATSLFCCCCFWFCFVLCCFFLAFLFVCFLFLFLFLFSFAFALFVCLVFLFYLRRLLHLFSLIFRYPKGFQLSKIGRNMRMNPSFDISSKTQIFSKMSLTVITLLHSAGKLTCFWLMRIVLISLACFDSQCTTTYYRIDQITLSISLHVLKMFTFKVYLSSSEIVLRNAEIGKCNWSQNHCVLFNSWNDYRIGVLRSQTSLTSDNILSSTTSRAKNMIWYIALLNHVLLMMDSTRPRPKYPGYIKCVTVCRHAMCVTITMFKGACLIFLKSETISEVSI